MTLVLVPFAYVVLALAVFTVLLVLAGVFLFLLLKAGKGGRALLFAAVRHYPLVEEYGVDHVIRYRKARGDGIFLHMDKIGKVYKPGPASKFATQDGVTVYPAYAPWYVTLAPDAVASMQLITEKRLEKVKEMTEDGARIPIFLDWDKAKEALAQAVSPYDLVTIQNKTKNIAQLEARRRERNQFLNFAGIAMVFMAIGIAGYLLVHMVG